jgi:hypothetical protein
MHDVLLFLGVWGGYLGFLAVFFAVGLWAVSIDDDAEGRRAESAILWMVFWPLIGLYLWLTRRILAAGHVSNRSFAGIDDPSGRAVRSTTRFKTIREAKDYLAARIGDEAEREGTPLTEVERKMLYFSETGWTLPDMKVVSAEFDRGYDQDAYERKITALASRVEARFEGQGQQERENWNRAIEKLSRGDHYLSILLGAGPEKRPETWVRHSLKVVAAAFALVAFAALDIWFRHWMRDH